MCDQHIRSDLIHQRIQSIFDKSVGDIWIELKLDLRSEELVEDGVALQAGAGPLGMQGGLFIVVGPIRKFLWGGECLLYKENRGDSNGALRAWNIR